MESNGRPDAVREELKKDLDKAREQAATLVALNEEKEARIVALAAEAAVLRDEVRKHERAVAQAVEAVEKMEVSLGRMRISFPAPKITAMNAAALASHLEKDGTFGTVEPAAAAKWLRDIAEKLNAFAENAKQRS